MASRLISAAVLCAVLGRAAPALVAGDINCDGVVAQQDILALAQQIFGGIDLGPVHSVECPQADVNGDGVVNSADVVAALRSMSPRTGPVVAFFGLASADGRNVQPPVFVTPEGVAVYQRTVGSGFQVVIEATPGTAGVQVGNVVFNARPDDPEARPDLQVEASRALGDGNPGVCTEGGIRGFDPADFSLTQEVADALNDFSCAFRASANAITACTFDSFGSAGFVSAAPRVVQFCLLVSADKALPPGDTVLTTQVRDVGGNLGPPVQILVRIGDEPFPTVTNSPTASRTATRTITPSATMTGTAVATRTVPPTSSPIPPSRTPSRPATPSATPMPAASPTPTASLTRTLRPTATPTRTPTRTLTPHPTSTPTRTPSVTGSLPPTATPTRTPTRTPTPTRTLRPSRTPTQTPSVTGTRPATSTPSSTRTPTTSRTPTRTRTTLPSATLTETSTATVTRVPTRSRTPTRSPSPTRTPTRTRTPPPTLSPTASRTPTATRSATATRTHTRTPVPMSTRTATRTIPPSATPTSSRTPTQTRTPTRTPSITPTHTITRTPTTTATPTVTQTPSLTPTPTHTLSPTATRTPSNTPTATSTATASRTPTITPTPTITQTPTHTVPPEPVITFFGVARADSTVVLQPSETTPDGIPVYERARFGFWLVIEGRPGGTNAPVGDQTFQWNPGDPTVLPDLHIIVSRDLGDGSPTVCDDMPSMQGGVPAVTDFSTTQAVANAINDLACRFKDGTGVPGGRGLDDACTRFPDGFDRFVGPGSTIQFCGFIDRPFEFPSGDTLVSARIRGVDGYVSDTARLIIRVGGS